MARIQQLSPSVVNKIAAGEVVERPASVLKELLENAVDAGATRIDVAVEQGGGALIRVADNGCGIAADELPLAIAPHATSKITSADDLFRVHSLGFRGEALASIAEVSRLVIRSRTANAESGAELEVVGGQPRDAVPVGCPVGTTIEVRNLFFNTPVRQKFLRTTQTEMGHTVEALTRLALAYPNIHFTLTHNDRPVHDLPPVEDLRERVTALFGQELADDLIDVESTGDDVTLSGYVANPMHSRATGRMQYLFLNGRAIRDRALQHALSEAYRGLLLSGWQPVCFLRFQMPPELVDVNVHPTKQEVRFQDSGRLYSQLLGTLRTKFLTTDLTARGKAPSDQSASGRGDDESSAGGDVGRLVQWAKEQLGEQLREQESEFGSRPASGDSQRPAAGASSPISGPLRLHEVDVPSFRPFDASPRQTHIASGMATQSEDASEVSAELNAPLSEHLRSGARAATSRHALQVHNRYLVVENEAGIEVIDQHALHERILYEQLREKVLGGTLESQRLLVPEPVDLAAGEAAAVLEHAELLSRLGVEVEPFGGETVLVLSYPAMLANLSPGDVLRGLVEKLVAGGRQPEARDLVDELLHMVACKAAVKFGDRLTSEEIDALLAQRHLAHDAHHCPHGRPTALVFTRDELDRQFKRI
jgi:DNA mismatch repair protein MutL